MNSTYLNLRKSDLYRYDGKVSDVTRMLKYFRKHREYATGGYIQRKRE